MPSLPPFMIEQRPALETLCKKHHVRKLELFGSAARDDFDAAHSDLDFLVEFAPFGEDRARKHADAYFGLKEDLERLFDRPVDLLERRPLRNPYLLKAIDEGKVLVYAAA